MFKIFSYFFSLKIKKCIIFTNILNIFFFFFRVLYSLEKVEALEWNRRGKKKTQSLIKILWFNETIYETDKLNVPIIQIHEFLAFFLRINGIRKWDKKKSWITFLRRQRRLWTGQNYKEFIEMIDNSRKVWQLIDKLKRIICSYWNISGRKFW